MQVALERLPAHERDDLFRGVVAPRLVAPRNQLFEDLAEHLRVDGDLDVQGRALCDREVEPVEKVPEDESEALVRHYHAGPAVVSVLLEQTAVKVWYVADGPF